MGANFQTANCRKGQKSRLRQDRATILFALISKQRSYLLCRRTGCGLQSSSLEGLMFIEETVICSRRVSSTTLNRMFPWLKDLHLSNFPCMEMSLCNFTSCILIVSTYCLNIFAVEILLVQEMINSLIGDHCTYCLTSDHAKTLFVSLVMIRNIIAYPTYSAAIPSAVQAYHGPCVNWIGMMICLPQSTLAGRMRRKDWAYVGCTSPVICCRDLPIYYFAGSVAWLSTKLLYNIQHRNHHAQGPQLYY